MDNENQENKVEPENKPVFMEVSMKNWEHLTSEQQAEIVDRIYSGFAKSTNQKRPKANSEDDKSVT
jgi:hypothetical protein